jgi:ADP-ribose pyrophosphatase YjhB (NUDIX family)/predicted transcriptional regulator
MTSSCLGYSACHKLINITMEELNFNQMHIINALTFKKEAKFSELNTENMPTDHFNYHLQKLIKDGLVLKNLEGKYELTQSGKKYSSQTDTYNLKIEKQAKIGVIPVCIKEENGQKFFLMHKRKKHPYFDWIGFPSGKAKYGTFFKDEVIRELEEETGLSGESELKIITHYHVYKSGTNELMEDKVFYIYKITNLTDSLLEKTQEGENVWMTIEEMSKESRIFSDNLWIAENIDQEGIVFREERHEMDGL